MHIITVYSLLGGPTTVAQLACLGMENAARAIQRRAMINSDCRLRPFRLTMPHI